ncbi:MAG: hypothetical protein JXA82_15225 [Sedimentisphaerales bacterium]|nr:hypothetical protein [Sedimentisphaerales bacterium]
MIQTYDLSDQEKCVILAICDQSWESLQQTADDLAALLNNNHWNNAIVDIRPITFSLAAFEELILILNIVSRMPDEIRLSILASYLDSEDAAYLIRRFLGGKSIFLGIFKTQDEARAWINETNDVVSNSIF